MCYINETFDRFIVNQVRIPSGGTVIITGVRMLIGPSQCEVFRPIGIVSQRERFVVRIFFQYQPPCRAAGITIFVIYPYTQSELRTTFDGLGQHVPVVFRLQVTVETYVADYPAQAQILKN